MSQRCLKCVPGCLKSVPSAFEVYCVYISLVFLGSMILKGVSRVSEIFSENSRKLLGCLKVSQRLKSIIE